MFGFRKLRDALISCVLFSIEMKGKRRDVELEKLIYRICYTYNVHIPIRGYGFSLLQVICLSLFLPFK